jgi:hypothetical protein
MSRFAIVILIYHRYKRIELIPDLFVERLHHTVKPNVEGELCAAESPNISKASLRIAWPCHVFPFGFHVAAVTRSRAELCCREQGDKCRVHTHSRMTS